jgi:hypothetical protein
VPAEVIWSVTVARLGFPPGERGPGDGVRRLRLGRRHRAAGWTASEFSLSAPSSNFASNFGGRRAERRTRSRAGRQGVEVLPLLPVGGGERIGGEARRAGEGGGEPGLLPVFQQLTAADGLVADVPASSTGRGQPGEIGLRGGRPLAPEEGPCVVGPACQGSPTGPSRRRWERNRSNFRGVCPTFGGVPSNFGEGISQLMVGRAGFEPTACGGAPRWRTAVFAETVQTLEGLTPLFGMEDGSGPSLGGSMVPR